MFPMSTRRRPMRPLMGAVMRAYTSCSLAFSIAAWSAPMAPCSCPTSDCCVLYCCWLMTPCFHNSVKRPRLSLASASVASSLARLASACVQLHLVGPRIDLHQQFALLDLLPFTEVDLGDLAVHARLHRNRVERRHRSETAQVHRHIARGDRFGEYGHAAAGSIRRRPFRVLGWFLGVADGGGADHDQQNEGENDDNACTRHSEFRSAAATALEGRCAAMPSRRSTGPRKRLYAMLRQRVSGA